jgi:hypothetical protein
MRVVRRHRRAILLIFSVLALSAMTYGFLRRVGIDPLSALRPPATDERR